MAAVTECRKWKVDMRLPGDESVILLHGLVRSNRSMKFMARALEAAGYRTVNVGYPSRHFPIEVLAREAVECGLRQCQGCAEVHFVTHSLGGILVRQYLAQNTIANLGKTVMLAPPNHGSEVVDRLSKLPGFKIANGDAGMQLGTANSSVLKQLGEVNFNLGIIAGTRTVNPILSTMLPNPDDGKVSVASTRVAGMNDHIQLPVTHTFMMRNPKVIRQVIHYLNCGSFLRPR
ncbi:alpha/beta hydrolase [Porticoccus sp. W117]|uniref:esterase/lipase family protein n=1 Tax=Porticoccus sp. W117 TaxID=3054777 RepID=UPI0025926926|nr:alpha/beta hydrolase [Porticoccus sp. W117]MDM3872547.1 alpha/beta hydrolase [Porticoccus sp. W117]